MGRHVKAHIGNHYYSEAPRISREQREKIADYCSRLNIWSEHVIARVHHETCKIKPDIRFISVKDKTILAQVLNDVLLHEKCPRPIQDICHYCETSTTQVYKLIRSTDGLNCANPSDYVECICKYFNLPFTFTKKVGFCVRAMQLTLQMVDSDLMCASAICVLRNRYSKYGPIYPQPFPDDKSVGSYLNKTMPQLCANINAMTPSWRSKTFRTWEKKFGKRLNLSKREEIMYRSQAKNTSSEQEKNVSPCKHRKSPTTVYSPPPWRDENSSARRENSAGFVTVPNSERKSMPIW